MNRFKKIAALSVLAAISFSTLQCYADEIKSSVKPLVKKATEIKNDTFQQINSTFVIVDLTLNKDYSQMSSDKLIENFNIALENKGDNDIYSVFEKFGNDINYRDFSIQTTNEIPTSFRDNNKISYISSVENNDKKKSILNLSKSIKIKNIIKDDYIISNFSVRMDTLISIKREAIDFKNTIFIENPSINISEFEQTVALKNNQYKATTYSKEIMPTIGNENKSEKTRIVLVKATKN